MNVRQVELIQEYTTERGGAGVRHQIVWVDASLPLKPGTTIRGKDKIVWVVKVVYQHIRDKGEIHDNWEVGGL